MRRKMRALMRRRWPLIAPVASCRMRRSPNGWTPGARLTNCLARSRSGVERGYYPGLHLRCERCLPRTAQLVARLEGAEVHHRHRVDDQMDDVAFRQPVHHVSWKKQRLSSLWFAEVVRHCPARVVGERLSNRCSPDSSTPNQP